MKPIEGTVVGDGHQPQKGLALCQQLIKEVENTGVQWEPEAMIRWQIPGQKQRKTGSIKQ